MGKVNSKVYQYSEAVSMSDDPLHSTPVYRSTKSPGQLIKKFDTPFVSSYSIFKHSARRFPQSDCFGKKVRDSVTEAHYEWLTYEEVDELIQQTAKFIQHCFLASQQNNFIGIIAPNCNEWMITDLACGMLGYPAIGLYQNYCKNYLRHIINQTRLSSIFGCEADLLRVAAAVDQEDTSLKNLICFDHPTQRLYSSTSLKIYDFWNEITSKNNMMHILNIQKEVKLDSVYSIFFSSGTTGLSKGAILTNQNLISSMLNFVVNQQIRQEDVMISYIPLAHIYGRAMFMSPLLYGCKIGNFSGNILELGQDMKVLKPTIFPTLPLVLKKMYEAIMKGVKKQKFLTKSFFYSAVKFKARNLRKKAKFISPFYDKYTFKKIREKLGGSIRLIITGGAQNSEKVMEFFKIAFSTNLCEIYGQTESSGASFMTKPFQHRNYICGGPTLGTEFKLQDVPSMNYLHTDQPYPRGEVCIRGPSVFAGYFNERTKSVIDKAGWLHTGDIGMIREGGALQIIDRKSNFFKLSHGDYLSPEKIERAYKESEIVKQIFVYGDSSRQHVVAIIVPEERELLEYAKSFNVKGDLPCIVKSKRVMQEITLDLEQAAEEAKLSQFEKIGCHFALELTPWTDFDLLTPTQKLKRFLAKEKYKSQIEKMYQRS